MSVKIGFQLIPQHGDFELMRERWMQAEALGVDALYTADHFFAQRASAEVAEGIHAQTLGGKNYEGMTVQAAMAATTTRPEIGCIVHGNSYRNPNLMADMCRTIDIISRGRFILGIGSGYQKRDYEEYGYELGTQKSRLLDLARDIPIIKARWEKLEPPPVRKIPIMIASMGEQIGMRIVAEHANIWHVYGSLEKVTEKTEALKRICKEVGRDFSEIELTTWYFPNISGEMEVNPDDYLKLGIRNIIQLQNGETGWDLGLVKELLAWRKGLA
jgi:probable F420-dependent oxidoreductase